MLQTVRTGRKSSKYLARWQQEQAIAKEISRTQWRSPSFNWRKDSPRNRATVTLYLTIQDNIITNSNVVIFHRRTERRYSNPTLSSLRRLSLLQPDFPAISDAVIEATFQARVAAEMLAAGQEQQFRLLDRVDAAIAYGQAAELVNTEQVAA